MSHPIVVGSHPWLESRCLIRTSGGGSLTTVKWAVPESSRLGTLRFEEFPLGRSLRPPVGVRLCGVLNEGETQLHLAGCSVSTNQRYVERIPSSRLIVGVQPSDSSLETSSNLRGIPSGLLVSNVNLAAG